MQFFLSVLIRLPVTTADRLMEQPIEEGYLILADISGYTSFLAETELDHAPAILRSILTLIVDRLTPTLDLAEVEGDAVFAYAPASYISRGELLLELIEDTYRAFRDRRRTMERNVTCPCKACQSISHLDLKFITHFGSYVLQDIMGTKKPVGTCVNLAHRLLKNDTGQATGWRGYALFSETSLSRMGVPPDGFFEAAENYEHVGPIRTLSLNLDERFRDALENRRVVLAAEDADVSVTFDFSGPPPLVWDWLNDPHKRNAWMSGSSWNASARPKGRSGPGAQNHCKNSKITEYILDWRPFGYLTVRLNRGIIDILVTDRLDPIDGGTRLCRRMRLEGSWPRWVLRPLMKQITARLMQPEKAFRTLNQLMVEAGTREEVLA